MAAQPIRPARVAFRSRCAPTGRRSRSRQCQCLLAGAQEVYPAVRAHWRAENVGRTLQPTAAPFFIDSPSPKGGSAGNDGDDAMDSMRTTGNGGSGASGGGGMGGTDASGGVSGIGGVPGTGGLGTSGTIATGGGAGGVASGGTGTGGVGTGGQGGVTCTGTSSKLCNGTCIPATSCCGGCSGITPICSNGTCVAKTIGDTCSTSTECATGVCADGVCCNVACSGRCESCATASSKGTCVPVTTPRTPCTSDGTLCGESAMVLLRTGRPACMRGPTHRVARPRNATAPPTRRAPPSLQRCRCLQSGDNNACAPYRCRTDSVPTCAASCPSGQSLCGGTCVDILGSDAHCGGARTPCGGSAPKCYSGACVQCLTASDCPSSFGQGAVCSESHACQCRLPSAGNVVQNAGFDQSSSGWTMSPLATFDASKDADSCSGSGSIRVTVDESTANFGSFSRCVPVSANTQYFLGLPGIAGAGAWARMLSNIFCGNNLLRESVVFRSPSDELALGWGLDSEFGLCFVPRHGRQRHDLLPTQWRRARMVRSDLLRYREPLLTQPLAISRSRRQTESVRQVAFDGLVPEVPHECVSLIARVHAVAVIG
jgi:hypothetical protein